MITVYYWLVFNCIAGINPRLCFNLKDGGARGTFGPSHTGQFFIICYCYKIVLFLWRIESSENFWPPIFFPKIACSYQMYISYVERKKTRIESQHFNVEKEKPYFKIWNKCWLKIAIIFVSWHHGTFNPTIVSQKLSKFHWFRECACLYESICAAYMLLISPNTRHHSHHSCGPSEKKNNSQNQSQKKRQLANQNVYELALVHDSGFSFRICLV